MGIEVNMEVSMEVKWFAIAVAVVFGIGGVGVAVGDWQRLKCKQELATSTSRTAQEIEAVCK